MKNYNKGDGTFVGLEDDIPEKEKEICQKLAEKSLIEKDAYNIEKNLEKDTLTIPNQEIALVSFIGPYNFLRVKHDTFQFCLRGAAGTEEGAISRMNKIRSEPDGCKYDMYTLGMNEWIAMPPTMEFMNSVEKHEEFLNKIIIRHKRKLELDKHLFEKRKELISKKQDDSDSDSESEEEDELKEIEVPQEEVIIPTVVPEKKIKTKVKEEFDPNEVVDQGINKSQMWGVVSMVGSLKEGKAIKIHAFFAEEDEARNFLDKMKSVDDTFDTFIVKTYRWVPIEPNIDDIEDCIYSNETLTKMHKTHMEEQKRADDYHNKSKKTPLIPQYEQPELYNPIMPVLIEGEEEKTSTPTEVLESLDSDPKSESQKVH